MTLSKSKGNMYPWVDYTWNPIAGKCLHECSYCYMNRIRQFNRKYRGKPRLWEKAFEDDLGEGRTIFVGSATDMFACHLPYEVMGRILNYCHQFDNTYLFQSKNPLAFKRYYLDFPDNLILGTTIETTDNELAKSVSKAPTPLERIDALLSYDSCDRKMVSLEPLMTFNLQAMLDWLISWDIEFVSIGADSGHNNLPEPPKWKVRELINRLEATDVDVKVKENLSRILGKNCEGEPS